ncbi:hypothetical protein OW763_14755 [Clostridium aestuarii]|uniref:Uncharacterized protein n=1 Tax=Clostridium aestuarii TaxID=338193 RepID=A0ABT4D390_9CLOT|nr:CLC_0170 family protein [Clostridium aestuarii]MCY6485592.1 hypothetical protein [Clostridium aestuarii]
MRIIDLFGRYFLMLLLIQGIILGFYDSVNFKKANMPTMAKKSKIIGRGMVIIGIVLFIIRAIL